MIRWWWWSKQNKRRCKNSLVWIKMPMILWALQIVTIERNGFIGMCIQQQATHTQRGFGEKATNDSKHPQNHHRNMLIISFAHIISGWWWALCYFSQKILHGTILSDIHLRKFASIECKLMFNMFEFIASKCLCHFECSSLLRYKCWINWWNAMWLWWWQWRW